MPVHLREQTATLFPRQKRGREAVPRDGAQLAEGKAEMHRRGFVFIGERGVAHQTVVGVEHDVQTAIVIAPERVGVVALSQALEHVAGLGGNGSGGGVTIGAKAVDLGLKLGKLAAELLLGGRVLLSRLVDLTLEGLGLS